MLAGILLKLGGYGVYLIGMLLDVLFLYGFFISLGLVGLYFIGLVCVKQIDVKSLIAYSSVGHMSIVMIGSIFCSSLGLRGAILLILGHGISSSGLFYLSGASYERVGRRLFWDNKGGILVCSGLTLYWFSFIFGNIAGPFRINFLGEILLYINYFLYDFLSILFLFFGGLLCSIYSVMLFSFISHGGYTRSFFSYYSVNLSEIHLCLTFFVPLNIIFLSMFFFYYTFILYKISFCGDGEYLVYNRIGFFNIRAYFYFRWYFILLR